MQASGYLDRARHTQEDYGTNARILDEYVRDKKITFFEEAIGRMTSFPAQKFGIE